MKRMKDGLCVMRERSRLTVDGVQAGSTLSMTVTLIHRIILFNLIQYIFIPFPRIKYLIAKFGMRVLFKSSRLVFGLRLLISSHF